MESTFIELADIEIRDAGGGRHELEGICVPYDTPTRKAGPVPELFRRGALASAVDAAPKIRLFEDHDTNSRPVGAGLTFADEAVGLRGRFRFYDTPQGRAAFENAKEGTFGGLSVGFQAVRDVKTDRGREVLEARLHHVALVDEPAYDAAQVVSVRRSAATTADRYELFRRNPVTIDLASLPDTPLQVRVRRLLSGSGS